MNEQTPSLNTRPYSAPVDPEHAALRMTVLLSFVLVTIVGYLIVDWIAPQEGFINLLGVIVGLVAGALVLQLLDRVLKKSWPSGRAFEIDGQRIRLQRGGVTQHEVTADQHVNVLQWRFEIGKRARVPKGWYVVALALNQGDTYLPLYTFMSPKDFEAMPDSAQFTPLISNKKNKQQELTQDLRAAGQERRLRTAEGARWAEGAELTSAAFQEVVTELRQRFPDWMPS
jgi:hypothetical protein